VLVLGIETSGLRDSVALLEAAEGGCELIALERLPAGRASELLLPTVAALLEQHNRDRQQIALIAVALGPGSFTGLRVALATTKGLAEALGCAVIGISGLEALALASGAQGPVLVVQEAHRAELFWGEYVVADGEARRIAEGLRTISGFAAMHGGRAVLVFTADAALAQWLAQAGAQVTVCDAPSAEDFARIACARYLRGERHDVATLDANYLRRSDAELFSAPKLGIAPPKP
jgi:tRNA threonylcarbamoyladenosine biosynthesis protein TsaB